MTLTYENLTEYAPHEFTADASDIGLPPGHWPTAILTNIGNRQPLIWEGFSGGAGLYTQALGSIRVRIFND